MIIPFGRHASRLLRGANFEDHDDSVETFEQSKYVAKYLALVELQAGRSTPSEAYARDIDAIFRLIVRRMVQRRILISFQPQDKETFSLPGPADPVHLEALFYWCVRLNESIPHILEAYARAGNGVPLSSIGRTIKKIDFEDSANKTDSFFSRDAFKDTDPNV